MPIRSPEALQHVVDPRPIKPRRGRRRWKLLLWSSLATIISLGVSEALLRGLSIRPFPIWSPRYMHVSDEVLGLVPAPHFVGRQETSEFSVEIRINSLGLRSPELPDSLGPVVFVLGDSFAFGHGVEQEETAAYRLAQELNSRRSVVDAPIRVLNAGVMSYGTWQAMERLRSLGQDLRPDLCILFFFAGNDPLDNIHAPLSVRDGYVVGADKVLPWWRKIQLAVKYRSSIYRLVAQALPTPDIPGACSDHAAFGFDLFRRTDTSEVAWAWTSTRRALEEMASVARDLGSELVVVAIPTRFQTDPVWWRRHRERCGFDEQAFDLTRVRTRLRDLCSELRTPFLDMLPAFERARHQGPLYFDSLLEMHLTPYGNEVLSRELAASLRMRGLIPGE